MALAIRAVPADIGGERRGEKHEGSFVGVIWIGNACARASGALSTMASTAAPCRPCERCEVRGERAAGG